VGDLRRLSEHGDRETERAVRLTSWFAWLFASGHAVDIVLAVLAVEFGWLTSRRHWTAANAAFRLLPGALMLVALRLALTGADWPWIALALALSFPVHLADLRRRG
jgi:hypothetical protein